MSFNVTRLYTDTQGETHFRDEHIDMFPQDVGEESSLVPLSGMTFRTMPDHYESGWHTTSDKQYVVILGGGVKMTLSTGQSREFKAGDIILVEDTTGKGHLSEALKGQARKCLFLKVPDDLKE